MAALRSLSSTQNSISNIQSQIQSGLKIGSATDDPSTFVISQSMRGDIGSLKAVKEGLNFGTATVTMAMSAATEVSKQIIDLQKKITQGENEGLSDAILQQEADEMVAQIAGIVATAEFNGINLLDGSGDDMGVPTGLGGSKITVSGQDATIGTLGLDTLTVQARYTEITMDNTTVFAEGDYLTFRTTDPDTLVNTTHVFEFLDNTGTNSLQQPPDEANATDPVFVHGVTIDPAASTSEHIGALAEAMRAEGFSVEIGDSGAIAVSKGGRPITSNVLNVATIGGLQSDDTKGGGAILALETARDAVGTILTTLGTFSNRLESQAEFTQVLTDTLEEGLGILVDANLAEVSAKLQSEQTKEQLGIQSLSIANASSQSILGLFR
jgi:flagellin